MESNLNKEKIKYLLRSILHQFSAAHCPYCEERRIKTIKRKYGVTRLVECQSCKLLFRLPLDPPQFNEDFYQERYVQEDHITTFLPPKEELQKMIESEFKEVGKGADPFYDVFTILFPEMHKLRVLDYGASWGYISFMLKKKGIQMESYEISRPRAKYGEENLGIVIKTEIKDLSRNNTIFFSSHVIEHVPSIPNMIADARWLTEDHEDVYFVVYCPNGSFARMEMAPYQYHENWGLVHPNFISDEFYKHVFAKHPYFMDTFPYDNQALSQWDRISQYTGNMQGGELRLICRFKMIISGKPGEVSHRK